MIGLIPANVEQKFFVLLSRLSFVAWFCMVEKADPEQFANNKMRKVLIYMLDEIKRSLEKFQESAP